jgi:hypothetical protein
VTLVRLEVHLVDVVNVVPLGTVKAVDPVRGAHGVKVVKVYFIRGPLQKYPRVTLFQLHANATWCLEIGLHQSTLSTSHFHKCKCNQSHHTTPVQGLGPAASPQLVGSK